MEDLKAFEIFECKNIAHRLANHVERRIIGFMAVFETTAGQLVMVTTRRLGDGEPDYVPFVVAEPDPAKAVQLVSRVLAPDERARAICPLSAEAIKEFGLESGQFTNRWWE
jgi:hypothetical protein